LIGCDLCLGFWVYTTLCFLFNVNIINLDQIISKILTGAISSFIVHIFVTGWKAKFQIINIE
jgi:hypothetical protein